MNPSAKSRCSWKIPYLQNIVDSCSNCIPFIALTETWLKPYVNDAQLAIGDYNILRCDRDTRVGGGVLLYTHKDLPVGNMDSLDNDSCQLLMCTSETSKMVLCLLYRSPSATAEKFKECLDAVQEYISGKDDYETCLLGDFNVPNISWDPPGAKSPSASSDLLLNFASDNLLSQYVIQPTRKDNILDLFFCNSASLVTHVSARDTDLSDHKLVEIYMSYNLCQPSYSTPPTFEEAAFRSLDFNKADFPKISSILEQTQWESLMKECDEEQFPELLTDTLLKACMEGAPLKSPPKRKCFTALRILSRKKRKLQKDLDTAKRNPTAPPAQVEALTNKIALLHYDIRESIIQEQRYREEKAVGKVKSNPKYFYSYAKKFSRQKQNISMLFDKSNEICTHPKQIAEILSKQFKSVFSNPEEADLSAANLQNPPLLKPADDETLSFTETDIMDAINEIRNNAASGPDGVPPTVLKNCREALAKPIFLIWEESFKTGVVPRCYKNSYISPLYKKGSRAVASNYRPVSLTSHIIKIFERVVRKKLVDHLESNNLLTKQQHGFRKGHSCLTQLLHHIDEVIENFMNGSDTDCIYLDYAKAFDKVDHGLLIEKLLKYGVNPKMVDWIKSFLTGRSQQVVVDGHVSLAALIISGVPQGTVLGPILFLVFINDITRCICNSTLRCFADDTRMMKRITWACDVPVLQKDLDTVIKWSERNNMALHEDKFEFIRHSLFKWNQLHNLPMTAEYNQYETSKCTLYPVEELRDLGVTVSSDLSWTLHIRTIAAKARQKAGWVLSVFHTRSPLIMLTLYKSMVRSLLEYCSPLWNPKNIGDIQTLEGVQRTFTSRIAGCYELDYWERLQKLSLMSLQRRRERYIILHMWKILHGVSSNDLDVKFVTRPRTGTQAVVPFLRKKSSAAHQTLYDSSFAVMGPKLWNAVPYSLNRIESFDTFKAKLTRFILTVPDKPPVRGYSTANSNSLLAWRMDSSAAELWGGQES